LSDAFDFDVFDLLFLTTFYFAQSWINFKGVGQESPTHTHV